MINTTEFREVEILEDGRLCRQKIPIPGTKSPYYEDAEIRKLLEHKLQKEIEEERLLYLLEFQNSQALRASEIVLEKRKEEEQKRRNAIPANSFQAQAERLTQSLRELGKVFIIASVFNKTIERFHKMDKAVKDGRVQITKDLYITRIIFNKNATVVFFSDGSKEIVKRAKGEKDCKSTAVNSAICNKLLICSKTKLKKYIKRFEETQ